MQTLERLRPLGLLVVRVVLGIILVAHGYPKVLGGEFHKHMGFVGSLGLPTWLAVFSAGTEFVGGILLILGLFTRIVGVFATVEMAVIIAKVHWKNGLLGQGGYQFPLALGAMAFGLIFLGGGPLSLDWVFARKGSR